MITLEDEGFWWTLGLQRGRVQNHLTVHVRARESGVTIFWLLLSPPSRLGTLRMIIGHPSVQIGQEHVDFVLQRSS